MTVDLNAPFPYTPTPRNRSFLRRILLMRENWLEMTAVVVLSVASLVAAWSSYQATLWNDRQTELYNEASHIRVNATHASTTGNLQVQNDLGMFDNWVQAYVSGNRDLQAFYRNRFSPELEIAVVAWLATSPRTSELAPNSPTSMEEYRVPQLELASDLEEQAARVFERGQEAGSQGNDYVLTTVFLALVLFFAGISTQLVWRLAKVPVVFLAFVILLLCIVRVLSSPMQFPDDEDAGSEQTIALTGVR